MAESEDQSMAQPEEKVSVRPAEFGGLSDESQGSGLSLDLVLDISMPVTVQLGKTSMAVKELLQLNTGAVVELDQMAGEPLDLYVRDVCFARGEVVVVDNNFGLRITEILSPKRRLSELGANAGEVDKTNER